MKATPPKQAMNPIDLNHMSFETALAQLESIVIALETEENALDDALALFERGQVLARHCVNLLDKAELKIKQLTNQALIDFASNLESS